jgi:hypothetical protein
MLWAAPLKNRPRTARKYDQRRSGWRHWGSTAEFIDPALAGAASSGSFDIATMLGQAAGGGVTGAIVTAIVSVLKKKLMG